MFNEDNCINMVSENWHTDMSIISSLYHSVDFSEAFYTDSSDGTFINETEYEFVNENTGITYTEFNHNPLNSIDKKLSKAQAAPPPGYDANLKMADLEVIPVTPVFINFVRIYPQYKKCGSSGNLRCRTPQSTQVVVNRGGANEVICHGRSDFSDTDVMLEILDSCDHWLYFDCPEEILGERFTVKSPGLQVVEFQAGLMDREIN